MQCCRRYPLASTELQKQVHAAFRNLHTNFMAAVQQVHAHVQRIAVTLPRGWTDEEATVFLHARAEAAYRCFPITVMVSLALLRYARKRAGVRDRSYSVCNR